MRVHRHLSLRPKPVAWAVATTAVVAMVASGCSSSANSSGANGGTSGVVKIGVSLPLTGGQSVPGKGHQQGYDFCVDELNANGGLLGHKVQLIVKDSRSDIQTGVNQVRQLISADKVNFLLGSFSTGESFPQETIAEQNRMVYLEPSDSSVQSHSRGYKYIFGQTPKLIDYLGQTPIDALNAFQQAGEISAADAPKTAAVVYEDSFFPVAVSRGILGGSLSVPGTSTKVDFGEGYLAKSGIKVVYKSSFPVDYNDWNSLASAIKASGADYLYGAYRAPAGGQHREGAGHGALQAEGCVLHAGHVPAVQGVPRRCGERCHCLDELGPVSPMGRHPERQAVLEPDLRQQLHGQGRQPAR